MESELLPRPGFMQRWAALLIVALVLIPVTLGQPYRNGPAIRSDGSGYHLWTNAILKGDLRFTWFQGNPADYGLVQPDPAQHRFLCKYPPGVALIRLPLMWFVTDPHSDGTHPSPGEYGVCLLVAALALLVIVASVLTTALRLGAAPLWANVAVLFLVFGTGLFHYATYDASFSHIYSALGIALLLQIGVGAVLDRGGRLPILTTLFLLALCILVRNTNAIALAFASLAFFVFGLRHGVNSVWVWMRNGLIVCAGVAVGASVQLVLNYNVFGHLQWSSYGAETFDFSRLMLGSILWSWERGLFTYYPILAVVLVVGFLSQPTRLVAAWFAALLLAYAVLYGFWSSWYLGGGFGHRGFVELVPLAIPWFALALTNLSPPARRSALRCGAIALYITLAIQVSYWAGAFPFAHATPKQYARSMTLAPVWRLVTHVGKHR